MSLPIELRLRVYQDFFILSSYNNRSMRMLCMLNQSFHDPRVQDALKDCSSETIKRRRHREWRDSRGGKGFHNSLAPGLIDRRSWNEIRGEYTKNNFEYVEIDVYDENAGVVFRTGSALEALIIGPYRGDQWLGKYGHRTHGPFPPYLAVAQNIVIRLNYHCTDSVSDGDMRISMAAFRSMECISQHLTRMCSLRKLHLEVEVWNSGRDWEIDMAQQAKIARRGLGHQLWGEDGPICFVLRPLQRIPLQQDFEVKVEVKVFPLADEASPHQHLETKLARNELYNATLEYQGVELFIRMMEHVLEVMIPESERYCGKVPDDQRLYSCLEADARRVRSRLQRHMLGGCWERAYCLLHDFIFLFVAPRESVSGGGDSKCQPPCAMNNGFPLDQRCLRSRRYFGYLQGQWRRVQHDLQLSATFQSPVDAVEDVACLFNPKTTSTLATAATQGHVVQGRWKQSHVPGEVLRMRDTWKLVENGAVRSYPLTTNIPE